MKHVLILAITLFGCQLFGQKIINPKAYESVIKKCRNKNVDALCVYQLKETYDFEAKDSTFFYIPDTFKARFASDNKNGFHVYHTPYQAMLDYISYCHKGEGKCFVIPEHGGIDLSTELEDTGKGYFDPVPVIEDDARDEVWSIESGGQFKISCDANSKSSLCDEMKAMKNVQKMTEESREYRSDLNDVAYDWEHSLNEFPKAVTSPLRDIKENGPDPMIDLLERRLSKLYAIREKWNDTEGRFR